MTDITTTMVTITGATHMTDQAALFDAMSWMSPAWPIGAFSYSGGLEWAVEEGLIRDRETCREWLATMLESGPMQSDQVFFTHAWRAITQGDGGALLEAAEIAAAAQTGFERRLESTAQGVAFRRIAQSAAPCGAQFAAALEGVIEEDLTYPVAAGVLFALSAIPLQTALVAFLHGAVSNLVSAAQRLVPLGQTDGQLVLAGLRQPILDAAARAAQLPQGDPFGQIATAALLAEIGCMKHETQYTRLFRT